MGTGGKPGEVGGVHVEKATGGTKGGATEEAKRMHRERHSELKGDAKVCTSEHNITISEI